MPPPITYNTLAVNCPAIQVPAVLPNPLAPAAVPKTLPSFVSGVLTAASLQQVALSIEALAERGSGIYAILAGFALTDGTGLNVRVSDGAAVIGGYVSKFTPTTGYATYALGDGTPARNRVWVGQQGQINLNTSVTPPAGPWGYAGSPVVNSGVITEFDLSGVVVLPLGGWPERKTADTGMPGDTPPANVRFLNYSMGDGSLWRWNGTAYVLQPSIATAITDLSPYATTLMLMGA